ncbi:serine hydrolase domain-containing protein [Brevundimonas sp.]|uniref:serine hydrolase domain-containing protein n=1 Tax=Brevundimonas sp. TaxID=1871086 RepID=UPI002AB9D364|nr:serine hydrolase domain-containing protein [Brevundimonas sp.]MDZ4364897.1 serine hydrolase domain-containing protein [Brevundimonas sp.]
MTEAGGLAFATSPEAVGFDTQRLSRLDDYMSGMVASGQVAGTSTLLMRHGQIVAFQTHGQARLGDDVPLGRDAIFRIYSMTKPVTGVALMILFEEGRWTLDDPITRFLPELSDLKVFTGMDAHGDMVVEDAARPPTMRELMSHTAGFGYGLFDFHPVERAYRTAGVLRAEILDDLVRRVAGVPLMFQPGTEWFYSIATDLQGLIVERISGQTFGAFLSERILEPLGMVDTGFQTRPDNQHRLAAIYRGDGAGGLKEATTAFDMPINDFTRPPRMEGGGGGLVSTATDYARFCQMILNRGQLEGTRILTAASIDLMATNMIPDAVLATTNPFRLLPFNPAFGFGLDFAVMLDPAAIGAVEGRGTLSWGGGGGTWFWIDPENDLIFVGLIQRLADPVSDAFRKQARTLVYAALTHPEK